MTIQAVFIFTSPEADPNLHYSVTDTGGIKLLTFAVKNYEMACDLVRNLIVKEKIDAIELCGGFGVEGVALVNQAAGGKIPVGVVRFDHHPLLVHQTGDDLFA